MIFYKGGEKVIPYIGITDFTSFEQVTQMYEVFSSQKSNSKRILHVGVMMSYKTLNNIATKWSKAFPPKETIANIFHPNNNNVYYCLHYADYDHNTKFIDLASGLEYAGQFVSAIQLDMTWPDPDIIANGIHASHKQVEVILQVGKKALEEASYDPTEIVYRLRNYDGLIHRVLLDKSMGRGLGMDANVLIPFAQAIREKFPLLGIVVAGGLGPKTIQLVAPLAEMFPDLSIDAQGQLRPSGNALDPVDWTMAKNYLIKALQLFA